METGEAIRKLIVSTILYLFFRRWGDPRWPEYLAAVHVQYGVAQQTEMLGNIRRPFFL